MATVHFELLEDVKDKGSPIPPLKATPGSVGFDLYSPRKEKVILKPGKSFTFKLGIVLHFPDYNTYAQILS